MQLLPWGRGRYLVLVLVLALDQNQDSLHKGEKSCVHGLDRQSVRLCLQEEECVSVSDLFRVAAFRVACFPVACFPVATCHVLHSKAELNKLFNIVAEASPSPGHSLSRSPLLYLN